jgi:hydrogenase maturation protease
MAKNIVIGIGNLLFCDDGIGVIAASYLKRNFEYEPKLEIIDGGTLGLNLIEYFVDYDNVFIIDTISTCEEVGSIYKIPSDELLGGGRYKNTAHEVEVIQMLEICELYDKKAEITIFGIVPQDINSMEIGLSKKLIDKFDMLIETIIKNIGELDIRVTKKASFSAQEIIKEFG